MIIKIQALMRGFRDRKRVKALRASRARSMMNHFDYNGPENFDNPDVQVRSMKISLHSTLK